MEQIWQRLPLAGANNVRELGGLPAADGGQTGWGRFLRADQLQHLTAADRELLYTYGVRTVIDLRSISEVKRHPNDPQFLALVDYHHVPFMREDLSPEGQKEQAAGMRDLSTLYLALLERKEVIRELFELIAQAREGCILFHCMAGKDRTGVLAMLLLMLAGVDKQDCLTNYMQSYLNLSRQQRFRELNDHGHHHLIGSDPEFLEAAYETAAAHPQGAYGFLSDCGIAPDCLDKVRERCLSERKF